MNRKCPIGTQFYTPTPTLSAQKLRRVMIVRKSCIKTEKSIKSGLSFETVKPCPHCRRKVRLSQKTATVAVFCDSLTFSATMWTGYKEIGTIGYFSAIPGLRVAFSMGQVPLLLIHTVTVVAGVETGGQTPYIACRVCSVT